MPTLSAMFKLMDGFSTTASKVATSSNKATEAIIKTSKETDALSDKMSKTGKNTLQAAKSSQSFNNELDATAMKANVANNSLTRLLGTVISIAGIGKIMSISDTYTNSTARLNMVNDGTQTQGELQNKVFDAAIRSRGSYTDMASAVSKMNLLAGDSFSSNDEAIRFTELLQKSLKVSGAGTSEQQSAFLQLTQAMAAGKLQGDEFRSIMENAPMVANAISKTMGVSKGELKELSSQGAITADIIKESMFNAGDDIESMFNGMPMTFADVGKMMANTMLEKFSPALEKLNGMVNSSSGQQIIAEFNNGIDKLAGGVDGLIDAIVRGDPIVKAFFGAAIAMAGIFAGKMLVAAGATLIANWPLTLIFGTIALIIFALDSLGVKWESVFGKAGMRFGFFYSFFYNGVANIWNQCIALAEFVANFMDNPLKANFMLYVQWAKNIIDITNRVAQVIDAVFKTSLSEGLTQQLNALEQVSGLLKDENYISYDDKRMKTKDMLKEAANFGNKFGKVGKGIDDWDFSAITNGLDSIGTTSDPLTVQGTGTGGAVDVDMADEDIQYLRDLAQRDYVAKIASNTLAPNIRVEFTGAINKSADANEIAGIVTTVLSNEIEQAPEGVY